MIIKCNILLLSALNVLYRPNPTARWSPQDRRLQKWKQMLELVLLSSLGVISSWPLGMGRPRHVGQVIVSLSVLIVCLRVLWLRFIYLKQYILSICLSIYTYMYTQIHIQTDTHTYINPGPLAVSPGGPALNQPRHTTLGGDALLLLE